jgi:hypothetical protein
VADDYSKYDLRFPSLDYLLVESPDTIQLNDSYTRGQTNRHVVKFAMLSLLTLIACNALSLLLENGNNERPVLTIFSLVHASCFI